MEISSNGIHLATALMALEIGLSPVPPADDGTKRPVADIRVNGKWTWEPYQIKAATRQKVEEWYRSGRTGNGLATGFGGLECLEFDSYDIYESFLDCADEAKLTEIIGRIRSGYEEFTPGGGVHWLYYCDELRGNTKLAERPVAGHAHKREVLIETRGEGGFIVTAPSCGRVHPSGKAYKLVSGSLAQICTLSSTERDRLWDLAKSFDELPAQHGRNNTEHDGSRPGDIYEAETTWPDILEPMGWKILFQRGEVTYWTRPGKEEGVSATTGHCKGLYVFSTSTSFEPRKSYSKFGAYAHLSHGGDHKAAAKALADLYSLRKPSRRALAVPQKNGSLPTPVLAKLTIGLDEFEPQTVDWFYENRIAPGFISLFAGRSGLGKSFVTCDIVARFSRGEAAPYSDIRMPPVRSLFISEDSPQVVLGPRLIELRADRSMIRFMTWDAMAQYTIGDTDFLERAYQECGRPALIVIDPPANFLGSVDEHKNAEVRAVLKALVAWLELHRAAAILITHINKQIGKGMDAVERIMGSVAWGSVARVTCAFTKDPNEPGQLLFGGTKNNLGELAETLAYKIVKTEKLATVEWQGKSDANMDDAVDNVKKKSRGVCAVEWLEDRFREKTEWESSELRDLAVDSGISKNALWSPEVNALPIDKKKRTNAFGDTSWIWRARDGWPSVKTIGNIGNVGNVDTQDVWIEEDRTFPPY